MQTWLEQIYSKKGNYRVMDEKGLSEDYFGPERDFWWNKDYLELLAQRWNLHNYSTLLDVGCGRCHWSKLICDYLKKPVEIVALDNDIKWAKGDDSIREYFEKKKAIVQFLQGDAEQIPLPDNTKMKAEIKKENEAIAKSQYSTGGAYVMYLVSGKKM